MLSQRSEIEIVGEAQNGLEALEKISLLKPDLVFLDIDMPELNGLQVAQTVSDSPKSARPDIVFITAYDEHALKAFDVHAIDYLIKPVSDERLAASLEKVQRLSKPDLAAMFKELSPKNPGPFAIRSGNKFLVCDPQTVSAIFSQDHYSAIVQGGRQILADESLDSLAAKLDPRQFIRVHRGAIINLRFLQELKREGDRKYLAILNDTQKTQISISREKLEQLKKVLSID